MPGGSGQPAAPPRKQGNPTDQAAAADSIHNTGETIPEEDILEARERTARKPESRVHEIKSDTGLTSETDAISALSPPMGKLTATPCSRPVKMRPSAPC